MDDAERKLAEGILGRADAKTIIEAHTYSKGGTNLTPEEHLHSSRESDIRMGKIEDKMIEMLTAQTDVAAVTRTTLESLKMWLAEQQRALAAFTDRCQHHLIEDTELKGRIKGVEEKLEEKNKSEWRWVNIALAIIQLLLLWWQIHSAGK